MDDCDVRYVIFVLLVIYEKREILLYFRFTEVDDNKKLECNIKPRHEPAKRAEGGIIVLGKSYY